MPYHDIYNAIKEELFTERLKYKNRPSNQILKNRIILYITLLSEMEKYKSINTLINKQDY